MGRGVSADEKRTNLLKIFTTKAEPLTLKELEKLGPKMGVRYQVVKEVLEEVVADGLVEQDKVGVNSLYWSFPSAAGQKRSVRLKQLKDGLESRKRDRAQLERDIEQAHVGKEDSEKRRRLLKEYDQLKLKNEELRARKAELRENDPKAVQEMLEEALKINEAVSRWTDNIVLVRSWMIRLSGGQSSEAVLNESFGIPDNLDYLQEMRPQLFMKR